MSETNHPPQPPVVLNVALQRSAALSLFGLFFLCLLWEIWLAPLKPGGTLLFLKALPLAFAMRGVLRGSLYTIQWASMLVLLYLMEQGWGHDAIQKLLYKQSGLLGVSGESADMRTLRASSSDAARFATDLFAHRVVREVGALSACIGGLDVLAFTGGIGEHDAVLRQQVGDALAYLGVHIDAARNAKATGDSVASIHADNSAIEVWVIPTDEGRVAAQDALAFL